MDENDIMAQLAALQDRFARMDEDAAKRKRDDFINSDSQYFSGDKSVTGRIFDALQERGIDTDTLDAAARKGIYDNVRERLNQLAQTISVKMDEANAKMEEVKANTAQAAATAQSAVAEMGKEVSAMAAATGEAAASGDGSAVGIEDGTMVPSADMGAPADMGTPAPADMGAPAPDAGAEMGAPAPADMGAPAPDVTGTPADLPTDTGIPPLPATENPQDVVSDERMKDVKGQHRLGGESHKIPKKLSDSQTARLAKWREQRSRGAPPQAAAAAGVVSDVRMKHVKPSFAASMISACRGGM